MEKEKELTLNEYQKKAMLTCMTSCENVAYMLTGLTAEVGEVNDKIAKAIRKGYLSIHRNDIAWWVKDYSAQNMKIEIVKELGDCLWFIAGMAKMLGYTLEEVAETNIAKLASRAERNVIDGNGDNR